MIKALRMVPENLKFQIKLFTMASGKMVSKMEKLRPLFSKMESGVLPEKETGLRVNSKNGSCKKFLIN